MPTDSPATRRAATIEQELNARTDRLAAKLKGEFQTDDAAPVSQADFQDMIRRKWSDPQWRQETSDRMGAVPFFKAAMSAFSLPMPDTHHLRPEDTINSAAAQMAGEGTLFPNQPLPQQPQASPLTQPQPAVMPQPIGG